MSRFEMFEQDLHWLRNEGGIDAVPETCLSL